MGGGSTTTGGGTAMGGGGGSMPPDAGPGLALTDFCTAYPAAACAHFAACGEADSANSPSCLALQSLQLNPLCADVRRGVRVFDGHAAQACLDELSATPAACSWFTEACGALVASRVDVQFSPVFSPQTLCGGGCDGGACDQSCTGGQCEPFRQPGEACRYSGHPLLACDPATGHCESELDGGQRCIAFVDAGAPCGTPADRCAPNSFCLATADGGRACQTLKPMGAACTQRLECSSFTCLDGGVCGPRPSGDVCLSSQDCGAQTVCRGLQLASDGGVTTAGVCGARPALGEACSFNWGGGTDPCGLGAACLDQTCVELRPFSLDAGSECPVPAWGRTEEEFYGFRACSRGLECQRSSTTTSVRVGRCVVAPLVGEPCTNVCVAGAQCRSQTDGGSVCVVNPVIGEVCTGACRRDSRCAAADDAGVRRCVALSEPGQPCTFGSDCKPGLWCDQGACVEPTGRACSADYECGAGACDRGVCVAVCTP